MGEVCAESTKGKDVFCVSVSGEIAGGEDWIGM